MGKIWELHEDSVKSDFRQYINNYRPSSQKGYWNVLKVFLEATDKSYGQTKGPARHKETWQWNDVSNSVSETKKLCKEWKQRKACKEEYLKAQKKANRVVYPAICEAQRKIFRNVRQGIIRNVLSLKLQRG